MKTKESRFQVHDELTAPERSVPILKGALSGGGQLPNFIGVLAGSPAVLRAYARFRSELRNGSLPYATQQRIALVVRVELAREGDLVEAEAGVAGRALERAQAVLAVLVLGHGKRDALLGGVGQRAVAQLGAEAGVGAQDGRGAGEYADEVRKLAAAGQRAL